MNGEYLIANPRPGVSPVTPFHRGNFFDVYSHNITTRYGEVFWMRQPRLPLPPPFVAEFAGRVVVLTGYEVDTVRTRPDGLVESVPLTDAYNHHHCATLFGAKATLVNVGPHGSSRAPWGGVPDPWEGRPHPLGPRAREAAATAATTASATATTAAATTRTFPAPALDVPTAAFIVDGNGGEYRKSLHATAAGFGMLVAPSDSHRGRHLRIGMHPMH